MAKETNVITEHVEPRKMDPRVIEANNGDTKEPEKKEPEKPVIDVEAIVTKVREDMEAQFKNEINGLNRKITELQTVAKQKDDAKKTVEERLADLEKSNTQKQRELDHEKLIRQLQKEAADRGLKLEEEIDIDNPALTLERGIEFLEKRKEIYAARDKRIANDLLQGNSPKPGSGVKNGAPVDLRKLSREEIIRLEEEGKLNELINH